MERLERGAKRSANFGAPGARSEAERKILERLEREWSSLEWKQCSVAYALIEFAQVPEFRVLYINLVCFSKNFKKYTFSYKFSMF